MSPKLFFCCMMVLVLVMPQRSSAQNPPYYNDIQHFKHLDSAEFPPSDAILFIGSSTFTKWTDIHSYFPELPIINRGFGGSTLVDVIRYAGDVIYPYRPRQVVIYCGDNDLAVSDTVTAATVVYRSELLFGMIRQVFPSATIDYVSIKYSPSRRKLWPKITAVNQGVKTFIAHQPNAAFIDITAPMRKGNQQVDSSLFLPDMLHMKPAGYRIWQKAIAPYLK